MIRQITKNIFLLVAFLPGFLFVAAQQNGPVETKDIYLKIIQTYRTENSDTTVAVLGGAKYLGLEHKQLVKAYQSSLTAVPGENEARDFREVASGKIILLDSFDMAVVIFYNKADTLNKGDMVSVRLNVPALPYRSIFSTLAFYDIILTNADKEPLYSLQDMISNDSRQVEDSILTVLLNDIHDTYQRVKDRTNLPTSMRIKIPLGRFKGKTPLEVLRDATKKDLEAFLIYCSLNPVSYMGKNFRTSESMAAWLISNSPYSYPEVKTALFPVYKDKAAFAKLLPVYKSDIISESIPRSLGYEAIEKSDLLNYKEAYEIIDFAMALAYAVNDTAGKPYTHLAKAQIFLNQDKYAETIVESDKAIAASLAAGNKDIELQAILKKAFSLYKISKYKEAELVLAAAVKKLNDYRPLIDDGIYNSNIQKVYEYRSSILFQSGEYENSLAALDTAIMMNNRINSYDAKIKNAGYYSFIGRVNNEKGKPKEALAAFEKAAELYRNNSDAANRAIVENDISYSYYLLAEYRKAMQFADSAMKRLLQAGDYNNAGYSRTIKAGSYWELGQYDSALVVHKEAIELRKKGNNKSGQAFSWRKIGELYLLSGQKTSALNAFDSAAQLYRVIKDSSGLAEIYNKKGDVYLNDESYKKAVEFFESAKGINSKSTVEALYKLGSTWEAIDTVKAARYYEESRQLSKSTGNTSYQFYAVKALASLAFRSHNTATGDKLFNECVLLSRQLNTDEAKASCLALKGYRFTQETQLDSAIIYYTRAKEIFDTVDKSQAVWQLSSISNIYLSTGEFVKADSILSEAITMARGISNDIALGGLLQTSSFLYALTADFDKGMKNSDSAISIFQRSGNTISLANTYGSRGTLLKSMGEYKKAVSSYLFADSIYSEELQAESRGIVFNNIGITYLGQADYNNALRYFQQSLSFLKPGVIDEGYLLVQGNISECLFRLKRSGEAKTLLLDIYPKAKKAGLNRIASGMALILGYIYEEEKKLPDAYSYFNYAKELAAVNGEKEKLIEALTNLGKINQEQGHPDTAEYNLRKATAFANQYKIPNAWLAFYETGLFYYSINKFDSSIVYFKQAVEQLDKNSENLYGGEEARKIFNNDPRKSDLYNKITFACYNMGNIKEAWAYANRSNIAGIKELSGSLSVNTSDEEKNEKLKKILSMQQSKKALENTLEKQEGTAKEETLKKIEILEADYNNFLQDIVAEYPELSTYFARSNADEFNNYKDKLPDSVGVLLYLLNNNTLMIFSLTKERLAVDTMTADISYKITAFIESVKNTNKQTGTGALAVRSDPQDEDKSSVDVDFKDVSDQLYRMLIGPVYDKIGGKKKLCIIPTGIFSNMPFQCLGKKTADNNFRFLIEDHCLFYTNKMSVFNADDRKPSQKNDFSSFAAFGVPDARLQYNISEVKAIGKIMGSDSTVYTANATESMAKQSLRQKKYVHFATHGVLNYSSDYSQSYLKFLPDKDTSNGNNGQLTMREVQKLGITDCDMVILSACETAVSKQLTKGWNISPANSFLVSHVRTVVASLWKVADEPTGLLMQYFYENLSHNIDKAEALRQAQIRLSQDPRFHHPNYWGAFVLYGDWRK